MLSRLAQQFAAEIRQHDWSDAPYRTDRAGHNRDDDTPSKRAKQLNETETERVRLNAVWVVGQVLGYNDPNFDVCEFALECGGPAPSRRFVESGLRGAQGDYDAPGTIRIRFIDDYPDAKPWLTGE